MIKKIPYQRRTIVRGRPISSGTPSLIFSLLNQCATQVLIGLFYSVMVRVYCESIYMKPYLPERYPEYFPCTTNARLRFWSVFFTVLWYERVYWSVSFNISWSCALLLLSMEKARRTGQGLAHILRREPRRWRRSKVPEPQPWATSGGRTSRSTTCSWGGGRGAAALLNLRC